MKKSIFEDVGLSDKHSIAHEALVMAETQFMTNDFKEEVVEDLSPDFMAFKDDDGFWKICCEEGTWPEQFDTYEELEAYMDKKFGN